ncbi:hypothetical protein [Ignavibacterium sp.]|uniref:hypothetical protein n=1 Tax=Ignavibacterium sp. TaxID=2651167 RepID=UPI00307D113B
MKNKLTFFLLIILSICVNAQWQSINNGLGSLQIKGLGVAGNDLIAVTADQGIFVSNNNGNSWTVHPQNSSILNFNINSSSYDWFTFNGMMIYGQGILASINSSIIANIPISGIANTFFTAWANDFGTNGETVLATNGGGVYYASNFSSTSWTQIPGLNNANALSVIGLAIYTPDNDDYLLVATNDGMYISPANSLSNLSPFNTGLGSNVIRNLVGQIALTQNGVYLLTDDNGLTNGWQTLYPSGDFRTMVFEYLGGKMYFFGNNVGIVFSGNTPSNEDLKGITDGAITSCALQYLGQCGGYIYVGTETGGVFRKQFVITSVDDEIIADKFELHQNYPKTFNPNTTLNFTIPTSEFVTLKVYDVLGNEVATLVNENLTAGNHSYNFDANKFTSKVYF